MSRRARICRTPNAPPVEGIRAATLDGLLLALAQRGVADPVVADLGLGEWRSHELARTAFAQLEAPWPLHAAALADPAAAAAAIGDWIDSEGRGDTALRLALELAETLFGALGERPLALVVLAPRFGVGWQAESAAFLRYLAHGVRPGDRLILVADAQADAANDAACPGVAVQWSDAPAGTPRPSPPGIVSLVAGAVDPATVEKLGAEGHPLRAGWRLVPPEWRRVPTVALRLAFDRLAAAPVEAWLRAFAQVYCNNGFVDPWFLCTEANRRLAEGSPGIALRLIDRAAACAGSLADRARLAMLAQGFRIALMRYDEAAAAPDPSLALPTYERGGLHMTKGWGLAMTSRAESAEAHLRTARELLEPTIGRNRQFLYLLNISALNRVNLGDADGALALEKRIEAESAALAPDARFDYVNFINLARLYRRRDEFDLSAAYYARAFATTAGARTESDLAYTNVCMARLEAARGRPREAFRAWLRASLHWLSSDVPEALGWRVLSAVLGRKAFPSSTAVEDVAAAFALNLRSAAEAAAAGDDGRTLRAGLAGAGAGAGAAPAFARADREPVDGRTMAAVGAAGFGVFACRSSRRPAASGPSQQALAALVTALAAAAAQTPALADVPTILVEDGVGEEMPVTRAELLAASLRLSVTRVRYDGEDCDVSPDDLLSRAIVRHGPAVARLHGDHVHFKRYLPIRHLAEAEMEIVAACAQPVLLSRLSRDIGRSAGEVLALVRGLEAARVLKIDLEAA